MTNTTNTNTIIVLSQKAKADNWKTYYSCQEYRITKEGLEYLKKEKQLGATKEGLLSDLMVYNHATWKSQPDWIYCTKFRKYNAYENKSLNNELLED